MINYTAEDERRDRMLMAAVWLIALGSVFLVKDLAGWGWSEAWPLFLVFLGIGTAGSAWFGRHGSPVGLWALWWPLALIVIGLIVLASTTGAIALAPATLIAWWPLAVIVLGIWFLIGATLFREPARRLESLSVPLGGVDHAEVKLRFGGGELLVGQAVPGILLSGTFQGGVEARQRGPGQIDVEAVSGTMPFVWDRPLKWNVALTGEVPLDLRLESGANRGSIDLSALQIRRLEVQTGASDTHIRLPAAGSTSAKIGAGVASLTLEIPVGVSARINSKVALGSISVDETRFPRSLDGWASPDFEAAANRVEIALEGGLGSLRVV